MTLAAGISVVAEYDDRQDQAGRGGGAANR